MTARNPDRHLARARIGVVIQHLSGKESLELAQLADRAGFHSIWVPEIYQNPFVLAAQMGGCTGRARIGTGVAGAFIRSPFGTANAAADVHEATEGRFILGLGTGTPDFLTTLHSCDYARPLSRMREYLEVLRTAWTYLEAGRSGEYLGDHYTFRPPPYNPWGGRGFRSGSIPLYLAAIRPRMLSMAGEAAEGALGFLQPPKYLEEHVRPIVALGARKAGRHPADIDIATEVICSISADRAEAIRRARIHVGMYVAHVLGDAVVAYYGVQRDQEEVRTAIAQRGITALQDATSDRLVEIFSLTGLPAEVRSQAAAYGTEPLLILDTPYAPFIAEEEARDAFRNAVDTFTK
jgi:alkanesulfonate monooxygenase SsuD/methylene tetrahydromethanopterin reductase-like flavin-dependent oxidoreductase (luciferase family)